MDNVLLGLSVTALAIATLSLLLGLGVSARLRDLDLQLASAGPQSLPDLDRVGLEVGSRVPDLAGYDISGAELPASALQQGPTLLVFVAPGCEPCEVLARTLPEFHLDHPSWLTFLVARGELEEVRTKYGALAPSAGALVVADPTERVAKSFKSSSTPHAFILESALVRARGLASGADSLETLAQAARVSPSDPAAPQPREHAMASLSQH
ncbi:MAG TPA: hypothetical protein DCK98_11570 [Chloroflexi bacterium]|jgi:thiol-disulfide isomerase/thioredoxin|nr:hypothetical protein [Chloroflexota bacterium]